MCTRHCLASSPSFWYKTGVRTKSVLREERAMVQAGSLSKRRPHPVPARIALVIMLIGAATAAGAPSAAAQQVSFSGPLGSTGSKLHAPAETSQVGLRP